MYVVLRRWRWINRMMAKRHAIRINIPKDWQKKIALTGIVPGGLRFTGIRQIFHGRKLIVWC